MKPKVMVRTYKKSMLGNMLRKNVEKKIFEEGYEVYSEEEVKKFNAGAGCLLLILFFPLVFFAFEKHVKVEYHLKETNEKTR